jgi:hypothetical protein
LVAREAVRSDPIAGAEEERLAGLVAPVLQSCLDTG